MKNINKNVSLAVDNRINIAEDMETVMNIFSKGENYSYTICFLGGRSASIFENIDKEEIGKIIESIFFQFLASPELNSLKILTNGATGGGIPEFVAEKFKDLQEKNKEELGDKHIQVIAVVINEDKSSCSYDYCIRVESMSAQMQAMINMSNLFIGLPGHTSTNLSTVIETLPEDKEKREYKVLLHPYWRGEFEKKEKKKVSFFEYDEDGNFKIVLEQVPLKENSPTIQKERGFKGLKEVILDCINRGLTKEDKEYRKDALLAIDFHYYIENEEELKDYSYSYQTKTYTNLISEFIKDEKTYYPWYAADNDVYGLTILPNGRFRKGEQLFDFSEEKEEIIPVDEEMLLELKDQSFLYDKDLVFKNFADFLNKNQYGQTLMWRYKSVGYHTNKLRFSMMVLFNYHLPMVKINTIKRYIEDFFSNFSTQKINEIIEEKNKEIEKANIELEEKINLLEKQARKSAYSQVFIRNMSHNIISHVLIHLLKGEELSEQKLPTHIERANAYQASFDLPWRQQNRTISLQDSQEQLACFLKYLSNRCFYLNESVYGITNTVGEKKVYEELFRELDENRILLNHISGIEHFNYKLHFVREIEKEGVKQYESLTTTNDFSVMLPGDTLGQQAFYNIIENIIRNTAKHNSIQKVNQCVHFIIKFSEHSRIYYKVEIFDSVVLSKNKEQDLNRMISDPEFDNNEYRLRSYGLGQLEMKAAAAFLRQKDITQLETNEELTTGECLPFLQAFETELTYDQAQEQIISKEKEKHLGYSFYLKKTEKYLIIINEDKKRSFGKKIEILSLKGIQIVSQEDFLKDLKAQRVFNHEFVFLCESAKENLKELSEKEESLKGLSEHFYSNNPEKREHKSNRIPILSLLPERLMLIKDGLIDKIVEKSDIETFEKNIWKQWEGEKMEKKSEEEYHIYQVIAINGKEEDNDWNNYSSCRQVVLHNHLNSVDSWKEAIENINIDLIKVEPLSSAAQRKLPNWTSGVSLTDYVDQIANQIPTIQKIIEAYFNKIIVIDERIQDFAETATYKGVPEKDIFEHINVLIPDKKASEAINLANRNISQEKKKVETYIQTNITSASFLVIHYGILERMYGSDYTQINKKLEDWAKQTRVVITTGRGKYSLRDLPQAVTYLNFSALRTAFIDNRNKYSMNYILNQSRK